MVPLTLPKLQSAVATLCSTKTNTLRASLDILAPPNRTLAGDTFPYQWRLQLPLCRKFREISGREIKEIPNCGLSTRGFDVCLPAKQCECDNLMARVQNQNK